MLSRNYRFIGPRSTTAVQRRGKSVRHGAFSLRYLPTNRSASRVAVVVSKKVNKRAPVRNRVRRVVYEQIRLMWDDIEQPYDMTVAVFNDNVASLDDSQLRQEIKSLLTLASLLKK